MAFTLALALCAVSHLLILKGGKRTSAHTPAHRALLRRQAAAAAAASASPSAAPAAHQPPDDQASGRSQAKRRRKTASATDANLPIAAARDDADGGSAASPGAPGDAQPVHTEEIDDERAGQVDQDQNNAKPDDPLSDQAMAQSLGGLFQQLPDSDEPLTTAVTRFGEALTNTASQDAVIVEDDDGFRTVRGTSVLWRRNSVPEARLIGGFTRGLLDPNLIEIRRDRGGVAEGEAQLRVPSYANKYVYGGLRAEGQHFQLSFPPAHPPTLLFTADNIVLRISGVTLAWRAHFKRILACFGAHTSIVEETGGHYIVTCKSAIDAQKLGRFWHEKSFFGGAVTCLVIDHA